MAGAKEIRTQISSVKNTQKITSAMEMVAASKMRKAEQKMSAARPYAKKIKTVVHHLASAHTEYKHPCIVKREVKRIGYIIISSDRGLCGGLNSNLFRTLSQELIDYRSQNIELSFFTIGTKAAAFIKRFGGDLMGKVIHLGDDAKVTDIISSVKVMLDAYNDCKIDEIKVVYNTFVNSMTQAPTIEVMVPIEPDQDKKYKHYWDYIYEPSSKEVLDTLITRYIESLVYHAIVENNASEQSARMVAMKSATDNAGDLINELQLIYNKARQAAITQEISEIVSGAAAVS